MQDYKFNRVQLLTEGVNGQISDIDFYDGLRNVISGLPGVSMEITASSVFRKNPFLNWVLKTCSDISTGYLSLLEQFMGAMELKYNRKGSIV